MAIGMMNMEREIGTTAQTILTGQRCHMIHLSNIIAVIN